MGVAAFERAPRQPAEPIDLAALGRELDLVGAGIAGHDLDLGAEDVAVKQRENVGIGPRALAAKGRGCDQELAEGLHRRVVAGDAEAKLVVDDYEQTDIRGFALDLHYHRWYTLVGRARLDGRGRVS